MEPIVLTGHTLTVDQFRKVVCDGATVVIADEALKRLEDGRALLYDLAASGMSIYGLNVGVGWNKDEAVPASHYASYNRKLILSHCIGTPPYAKEEDVRAALLARLNIMLLGSAGPSLEIPKFYAELLNRKIHPLIPEQGSVGQADIGLMSYVGLTVLGEGQVYYKGEIIDAKEALNKEGLKPMLELGPKDGLSIVSTNGLALGQGMLVLKELEDLMDAADLVYACSLEALNGNLSPFDERALKLKGDEGILEVGATIRDHLEGSFLHEKDEKRHLQDPLCFRDVVHIHGAVREMLAYTRERCRRALNAGEDNPSLLLEERQIIPTANFDPINWVLGMEALAVAASHVSHAAGHRIIKLANPVFTGLPRFLSPEDVLGFATTQKAFTAQYAKIRHLSMPASVDTFALAGEIEDKSTNAPYVVQKLRQIVNALHEVLALELLHAAQGQTYRMNAGRKLGKNTAAAYEKVRQHAAFVDQDRVLGHDIIAISKLLASGALKT